MRAAINPEWPTCEMCGENVWRVHREAHPTGFEKQAFTCSNCGHVTERTVVAAAEDAGLARLN